MSVCGRRNDRKRISTLCVCEMLSVHTLILLPPSPPLLPHLLQSDVVKLGNYFLSSKYASNVEDASLVAIATSHLARNKVSV